MILCFLKNDSDYCEGNGQSRASRVKRERRQKVRITVEVNALGDLNQMEAVLPSPSPHGPLNDATTESQHAMLCYYHMCATYTRRQAVRSMRLCLTHVPGSTMQCAATRYMWRHEWQHSPVTLRGGVTVEDKSPRFYTWSTTHSSLSWENCLTKIPSSLSFITCQNVCHHLSSWCCWYQSRWWMR